MTQSKQARYDEKKRKEAKEKGLKQRRFYVYPDDTPRIRAYIDRLIKKRQKKVNDDDK